MDKIFFIYQKGFRQISLPNKQIIEIISCDGGSWVETKGDMKEACDLLNKYIGLPIYHVWCDYNSIDTGTVLQEVKIVKYAPYEYESDYLFIDEKNIAEDRKVIDIVER